MPGSELVQNLFLDEGRHTLYIVTFFFFVVHKTTIQTIQYSFKRRQEKLHWTELCTLPVFAYRSRPRAAY